jgi:hypothetical protein
MDCFAAERAERAEDETHIIKTQKEKRLIFW